MLLRGHTWKPDWDPEGILSTVPAVVTCLIGVFAGDWLRTRRTAGEKVAALMVWGNVAMAAGAILDHWFPINKNLWSPSYVLFTGGMALVVLGVLHWAIDREGSGPPAWTWPGLVFGSNAILAFVLSGLFAPGAQPGMVSTPEGAIPVKTWIYRHGFASWAGPLDGSLAFALAFVGVWLVPMAVLYRKRWFVSV